MLKWKNSLKASSKYGVLIILAVVVVLPVLYVIAGSFMQQNEINDSVRNYKFHIIASPFTFTQYETILFKYSGFLLKFWNSVLITCPIVIGQIVVSSFGAYAFAKLEFPLKKQLFFMYILLIIMPYQVTLVPIYIMMKKLNLMGTYLAVILPGVFSTFGVFLLTQFMKSVPDEECEAAKVDGAGHLRVLFQIILPQCKGAIASLSILCFADNWNMIEQPQILLNSESLQPLSTFLSKINSSQIEVAFACDVLFMIPAILIYIKGEKELMQGIQHLDMK